MPASRYQDLRAWQRAIDLAERVYGITSALPPFETYGLKSQMRRCAVSVPSNIAEGQGRATRGEFQQFLGHARGSLYELETQTVIAAKLGYVGQADRDGLLEESKELGRMPQRADRVAEIIGPPVVQLTTDN